MSLEINKAVAINQRHGGDGNVQAKNGDHQHNNQTVKVSGLFNYELCSWNKLTCDFQKTTVS